MSAAFADAALQHTFERDGFTTFPLLDAATVRRLQSHFDDLGVPDDHEFFVSVAHLDRSAARATDLELKQVLEPLLRELLPDHEAFTATFISKGARCGIPTEFHQDLTYCDERRNRALIVWITLIDLDETIGAMECVPGSHRWTSGIRPHGSGALPTEHWQPHFADRATTVPLAAGSAAVWDPATVHGAKPYTGDRSRTAVAIGLLPTGTKMLHFYRDGAEEPDGFRVDESFFATHPFRTRPAGEPDVTPWAPAVRAVDFLPFFGAAAASTERPAPARQRTFGDGGAPPTN